MKLRIQEQEGIQEASSGLIAKSSNKFSGQEQDKQVKNESGKWNQVFSYYNYRE